MAADHLFLFKLLRVHIFARPLRRFGSSWALACSTLVPPNKANGAAKGPLPSLAFAFSEQWASERRLRFSAGRKSLYGNGNKFHVKSENAVRNIVCASNRFRIDSTKAGNIIVFCCETWILVLRYFLLLLLFSARTKEKVIVILC